LDRRVARLPLKDMASKLRTLGEGWQPLLEAAVGELAAGGLDVQSLWPGAHDRRAALERLGRLLDLVATWNARTDLTAARDERELVDLYLADALVLAVSSLASRPLAPRERWVDVGSGAGAPGLVLHVLRPDLDITLVEPRAKRVAFLRTALGSLGIAQPARVLDQRSDAVPPGLFDVAVSRATFAPDEWLREGARLAQKMVWVLLARAEAPNLSGWRVAREVAYRWPLTGVSRQASAFQSDIALAEPA
jgi:16S rRNA (guanine527-N7)-methyltransferase